MHAEMFPLIKPDADNPLELFQIWLNLPPESKMVPAHFSILWSEEIPTVSGGPGVSVDIIAGEIDGIGAPPAPPDSWASQPGSDLAIWIIRLAEGASWHLPAAPAGVNRMLHFFEGDSVTVDGTTVQPMVGARLEPTASPLIANQGGPAEFLLLQGRPIGAPVYQMGPFVMNSPEQLQQAVRDYHATQFGGWPWPSPAHTHARTEGRFAVHADGKIERRDMQVQAAGG